jgi:hypothetical protein
LSRSGDCLPGSFEQRPAARKALNAGRMSAGHFVWWLETKERKVTSLLAGRAGLTRRQLLSPTRTLIHLPLQAALSGCKRLLSLVTFFAAAKKVTPPPGRRLLNKKARKQNQKESSQQGKKTLRAIVQYRPQWHQA